METLNRIKIPRIAKRTRGPPDQQSSCRFESNDLKVSTRAKTFQKAKAPTLLAKIIPIIFRKFSQCVLEFTIKE